MFTRGGRLGWVFRFRRVGLGWAGCEGMRWRFEDSVQRSAMGNCTFRLVSLTGTVDASIRRLKWSSFASLVCLFPESSLDIGGGKPLACTIIIQMHVHNLAFLFVIFIFLFHFSPESTNGYLLCCTGDGPVIQLRSMRQAENKWRK